MPAPLDAPPTTVGPCTQRRAVLAALPGVVVLPGILSACGMTEPPDPASTAQSTTSVPEASLPTAEVPVGTAKQVEAGGENVIVAQPTPGESVAYSAGGTDECGKVQVVGGRNLRGPLHGAEYEATGGSYTRAPAPRPLDVVPVSESDGRLTLG